MTAEKLFETVSGLMFSPGNDREEYEDLYYPVLNLVAAECFPANNCVRLRKGLLMQTEIPEFSKGEDEIPYEEEIVRMVMPLGIAGYLYTEDDDTGVTNVYRERYTSYLDRISFANFAEPEVTI